jgi:Alpha galactosidase A/Alpha-galactosidase, CBM13 domain/Alpha galactosidase C-terminal beta sandwich domain
MRIRTRTAVIGALASAGLAALAGLAVVSAVPAHAENNGLALTPQLGWSSWSFIRKTPTAAKIEAQADAMKNSGLPAMGYTYVNLDDFWYQCPGSQGPNVDANGRWVTDTTKFPGAGGLDGIQVVANYVHNDGLKFGLYVTPGVSLQAVNQKSPILGTPYTVDQIAVTTTTEKNYNCHGMVAIDYTKPGAQEFINSWANEFASWGVDYLKIDGVGTSDIPDIQAWSNALRNTGRPIHLELSNSLAISGASTWQQYANGWRTGGDVECYCGTNGAVYPLTNWSHIQSRFAQVANWQPYGGPGGWNDYDSIEVGNGSNDGLTLDERRSQMSLWALAASPFILGTDLTNLDATDLGLLKNTRVLAVDQDGIDAKRIVNNANQQVYAKTEKNGDVLIGLFNYSDTASQTDTVDLTTAGIPGTATAVDVWSGGSLGTIGGTYSVTLAPGAVQLIRATPNSSSGGGFEAESSANTLAGGARVASCSACSGGQKVGYVGNGGTLTFNNISVATAGRYQVTIAYCDGSTTGRQALVSVNGGAGQTIQFTPTGSFSTPGTLTVTLTLNAGSNTIEFYNPSAYAPDFDRITVPATPSATGYEAESSANTLAGGARVASCSACSGGQKVGYVGNGGTLTFNGVNASAAGSYQVTIVYCDGSTTGRQALVSVNGGAGQTIQFTPTGSFGTPGSLVVTLTLNAGANTIEFYNPSAYAPDFDKISVPS